MAKLSHEQDLNVFVTHYSFSIQELEDERVPIPYPEGSEGGEFVRQFPMRLDLESAGHTHTASVKVEVWGSPPELADRGAWDKIAEAAIESPTGELAVWSDGLDDQIDLGAPGLWHVRVAVAGREEVERQALVVGAVEGVEHWLLQFWPRKP
ncbi:hypothetical protein FGW37_30015 [Streptomyces rectiverticillatus]|uniref:hypothetical protein n=1 Tax=Streptomyces rectiverticillatus TaxID=173860 RepID=UPI0015C322F7|nr:hypothetical protein [Streptomyces rectiverticillatus]QLE75266.1 hypothetical protein FGW37_30015 [Streptomyces rectiverticillatus]